LVKTSEITIKVFGTQFNVKSYPEENKVTTTLVKGSVAIESKDITKPDTYLKPNQTAVFFKTSLTKPSSHVPQTKAKVEPEASLTNDLVIAPISDPTPLTSWKDQRWVIDSEDLEQLAILLERRYNVKILFIGEGLKNYKFSGILTDETFEQVLKIIQLSAPVQFRIDHNQVVLSEESNYKKKYDNMINKTNN
jgi:ferric-dicitrate binding protein FerR (iron transport regulator)